MSTFINPIQNSYITSVFGYRTHPVTGKRDSFHQGVDLAIQPNTNVKILAAADGEVIRLGALGTYGNVVMIKHTINGKRMDTNYAHLKDKSITVKVGQKVKQGDVIGIMGNTGSSTAPHLHFEIHDGPWASKQPNAIDPAKYIKFYTKTEVTKMEEQIKALKVLIETQAKVIATQSGAITELQNDVTALNKNAAVYKSAQQVSTYAAGALEWATDLGLYQGNENGDLNPLGANTRQDAALVFQRYHENVVSKLLNK